MIIIKRFISKTTSFVRPTHRYLSIINSGNNRIVNFNFSKDKKSNNFKELSVNLMN